MLKGKKKVWGDVSLRELNKLDISQLAKEIKELQKDPKFKEEVNKFIRETTT